MVEGYCLKRINMTQKGFTLIELLVVVAIIGVLAAVGVLAFNGFIEKSKNTACLAEHKNRSTASQLKITQNWVHPGKIWFGHSISFQILLEKSQLECQNLQRFETGDFSSGCNSKAIYKYCELSNSTQQSTVG